MSHKEKTRIGSKEASNNVLEIKTEVICRTRVQLSESSPTLPSNSRIAFCAMFRRRTSPPKMAEKDRNQLIPDGVFILFCPFSFFFFFFSVQELGSNLLQTLQRATVTKTISLF